LKLLYVTSSLPYGKGEAFIIPEIEGIKKQGHEILIVPMYPRGEVVHEKGRAFLDFTYSQKLISFNILKKAISRILKNPKNTLQAFTSICKSNNFEIFKKNLIIFPKALWLADVVEEWKPDHIHVHWAATSATMAMIAAELNNVPWSITAHRWDIAENNLIALKAQKASFIRTIDQRGADELTKIAKLSGWKPKIIHMGVKLPESVELAGSTNEKEKKCGVMAANFIEIKGHIYLIDALKILKSRGVDVSFDFAGDGECKDMIEKKAIDLGLEKVKFHGAVPHETIIENLKNRKWDFMVLSSIEGDRIGREGIPVSLMEAMSCSVPVISTTTGGIPELVKEGAGILVPQKDSKALADAIQRIIEDESLRDSLGEEGKKSVIDSFDIEKVVKELESLFMKYRK